MVTLKDAKSVTDVIVESLQPVFVVVFGSVARKGCGSDLDLLIVFDGNTNETKKIDLLLHNKLQRFFKSFPIDRYIIPISSFRHYFSKGSPFLWLIVKEGKCLYMKDLLKEWMNQAKEELKTAEYLLQGDFFKGACYHSQQSVEKSIKSVLLNKGWELEKTHSVERLKSISEDYNLHLNISDEEVIFIDSIYKGRCPGEVGLLPLGEPTKADAERAIQTAKRIWTFAKTSVSG